MAEGTITIETELSTKQFDAQISSLEAKIQDLESALSINKEIGGLNSRDVTELEAELEKAKNKLVQLNAEKDKLNRGGGFESLSKSLKSSVSHAGRLVLGIFAIRSAYQAVRRASSDLASYDKQYAANLEYIRYALTQAIAPVLVWIVNLAAKLLQIIGMIVSALFGVNIFGKASAKNFQKMKAGAGGAAKAVKEIKKQLAGFDEMTILQDDSDSGGGGAGGGGIALPQFDLSKMGDVPPWLQWIKDNRELILGFLAGLLTFLTLLKLGVSAIKALGIGLMVWGIVTAVLSLLEYLKNPTWENFGKIIQGIGIFVIGLGVAFLGLPAIVTGVVILIVGTMIRHWEELKGVLQNGINWLLGQADWVEKYFGSIGKEIYLGIVQILQNLLVWFDDVFTALKDMLDGIIMFVKGVFTGNWQMAWEGLKKIFLSILKIMVSSFTTGFNNMLAIARAIINSIVNFFTTGVNMILGLFKILGGKAGENLGNAFKAVINIVLGAIENILNKPIDSMNALIDMVNSIPGVNITARLSTFNLPRLKAGGIVNVPNRGSLIGSAIAGESGAEGVIPLTDAQAMETLGAAIGRYITINANITNSMNGRVISRELKTIKNAQDFAYNT